MFEGEVKLATCQVMGSGESGTGWLIAADLVLTAFHCVESAARSGQPVQIRFGTVEQTVRIRAFDEGLDICLISLSEPVEFEPLRFDTGALRAGERWYAFGYPAAKLDLGHVVNGEIQQALAERVHKVDLDLSVNPETQLSNYRGLSGAAVIIGDACRGLLRIEVDSAIGAVSLEALKEFLAENNLLPESMRQNVTESPFGARPSFDAEFESAIKELKHGYLFIEGPPGIGKSTFCAKFNPKAPELEKLGVYHFSDRQRGSSPAYQSQPEVFFDWVSSLASSMATGKPARLSRFKYHELIEKTDLALQGLAQRSLSKGQVGLIFIDGINEAATAGRETFQHFVNMLPRVLPHGLVVIITGVGIDSIASALGKILGGAKRLILPPLDDSAQNNLCRQWLGKEKATADVVAALCDRAKGHPLYLQYIIDQFNCSDLAISDIPAFGGSIEEYYESIWASLETNADAVNLLGIFARMRWGISIGGLTIVLNSSEMRALPSVIPRIRHLLSDHDNTEIYHASFSEFISKKTNLIGEWVHGRLAQFCGTQESADYGIRNTVYHGLRGNKEHKIQAIQRCQQSWVDNSVVSGVAPEILLADINEALISATEIGTASDIVRLLLLSQRLTFRYDVLFVRAAEAVGLALISLGKHETACQHIVRQGRLAVDCDSAFVIVNSMITKGCTKQALEILDLIQCELNKTFEKLRVGLDAGEFLYALITRIHAFSLERKAGGNPSFTRFFRLVSERIIPSYFPKEVGEKILRQMIGEMFGATLCLEGSYQSPQNASILEQLDMRRQLLLHLQIVVCVRSYVDLYGIALKKDTIDPLLADVERASGAILYADEREFLFVDALIELGAAPRLLETCYSKLDLCDRILPFYKENRAEVALSDFEDAMSQLRAAFFLDSEGSIPEMRIPFVDDWEPALQRIACAVAWCDGKGRRAMALKNQNDLNLVKSVIINALLPCLSFKLESRVRWRESYSIPEAVVPRLYRRLARLLLDCYLIDSGVLLEAIERHFDTQIGLYNEGFRKTLDHVLSLFVERCQDGPNSDKIFSLILRWRDYASENVENRFEVVPELLKIIPLLSSMGAYEEAEKTYRLVLSFSMGPGWYKEDQLSMMTNTLASLSPTVNVPNSSFAQIASILDKASGEMTFQRFVRSDKSSFIAELCRRDRHSDAVRYFQHQSCGTLDELFSQATMGSLDRVSTLRGMRFPGGGLEEQSALLELIRNTNGGACWSLRWALLEVYQHGDERHLQSWGQSYAAILLEIHDSGDLKKAKARICSIANSLNSEHAWLLLNSLLSKLPAHIGPEFISLLGEIVATIGHRQMEGLRRSFGLDFSRQEKGESAGEAISTEMKNEKPEEQGEEDDKLYFPGTFGTQSSLKIARANIESARTKLSRHNRSAAMQECAKALGALQAGGWSIWDDNHPATEADQIILEQVSNADELARLYGAFAIEERHTQCWQIASRLISLVCKKCNETQQSSLLKTAIEHVQCIVGDASLAPFEYIGRGVPQTESESLFELLLWTLDHPSWERRDSCAAMLLWISRNDESYLPKLARLAVSMDQRNRADIASAILDILSHENPTTLWRNIRAHIDIAMIVDECRHAARFATIMRIADRASKHHADGAIEALHELQKRFFGYQSDQTAVGKFEPPEFIPPTLQEMWHDLSRFGIINASVAKNFVAQVAECCLPLNIDTVRELETLLAQGAREYPNLSTGRWSSILRYALNVVIFPGLSIDKLRRAEAIMRNYNPGTFAEPSQGRSLLASLVDCVERKEEKRFRPSFANLIFLDLQCLLSIDDRIVPVELTSHLVAPGTRDSIRRPRYSFSATELPKAGSDESIAVCGRARPVRAYFGSISPAVPTSQFLQLARAYASDIFQYHWRDGNLDKRSTPSRRHEAALLAIEQDALNLPDGWEMVWSLSVNGEIRAILNGPWRR